MRRVFRNHQSETRIACGGHFVNVQRTVTFHRCFLPSVGSFGQGFSEKIFFNRLIRNKKCGGHICQQIGTKCALLITGHPQLLPTKCPFIWPSSFRGNNFLEIDQSCDGHVSKCLGDNEHSSKRTFHRYFLPSVGSFGKAVSEGKIFQKSTNEKQELPVVAMFSNGSKQIFQSLQRTFHRCFLPSFGSFGQVVLEEKIFKNQPIRNKNCLWLPCLLMDRDKMCNLQRGPSIDASYQVSVHLVEGFQRRRLKCEKLTDDRRRTPRDGKSSHCLWQDELKKNASKYP